MSNLTEKIRQTFEASRAVQKWASDDTTIANAEQTPVPDKVSSPAEGQDGAAADIITDETGLPGQPGAASSEISSVNETAPGGVDAAIVEPTTDGEAAEALGIVDGEVTKEGIEMAKKANEALQAIGRRISGIPTQQINSAFEKQASAVDAKGALLKMASEGDAAAQWMCDLMASYAYGVRKKANDMVEAIDAAGVEPTEESVAATEDALNAAALENPETIGMDEDIDPEAMAALEEFGAELEAAAQEATDQIAQAIIAENPEVDPEEAYTEAQAQVADALQAADAQQLLGATDEEGAYLVNDEDATAAVDDMVKTASAFPLRGAIVDHINTRMGVNSDAFVNRITNLFN